MRIDWDSIKELYEGSDMSVRAIAKQYGVSHTAVNKKAKKEGWKRYAPPIKVSTKRVEEVKPHKAILGRVALRKIDEIKNELGENYSHVDEPLIVMFAKNYERYLELEKELAQCGITAKSPKTGSLYLHPLFNALQATQKNLITIANQLGLSIASRKKLGFNIKSEKEGPTLFDIAAQLSEEVDIDLD